MSRKQKPVKDEKQIRTGALSPFFALLLYYYYFWCTHKCSSSFSSFFPSAFLAFFICKIYIISEQKRRFDGNSVEYKKRCSEKALCVKTYISTYIYTFGMNLLCAGAEENRIKFSQLCFTFTWLYLSYMKLNGIHIIFIFMTRIGDAY